MYPDEHYNLYRNLHHDFSESYVTTGKQVMDFYPAWKNFIDTQGSEIGRLVNDFSAAETNQNVNNGFERLFYFLKEFREDALSAHSIMTDYNTLCGKSNAYMKKVFMLKEKNEEDDSAASYQQLIPELSNLINGFKEIEEKTSNAMRSLKLMQAEWNKIRERIKEVP